MCRFVDDPLAVNFDWGGLEVIDKTTDSLCFVGPKAGLFGAVLHEVVVDRVCQLEEFNNWCVIRHFSDISVLMFGVDDYFVTLALHEDHDVVTCTLSNVGCDTVYSNLSSKWSCGDRGNIFIDNLCDMVLRFCGFVNRRVLLRKCDFDRASLSDVWGYDYHFARMHYN